MVTGDSTEAIRGYAVFGDVVASELVEVSNDPACLDRGGWWAVSWSFEGELTAARFARVDHRQPPEPAAWRGVEPAAWSSSMSRAQYVAAVDSLRESIAAGTVYQANLCRVLSAPAPAGGISGLAALLRQGNPAPFAGYLTVAPGVSDHVPDGVEIASASPELFVSRDGETIESQPIKGTGRTAAALRAKDDAENIMIVDLVRNDLSRVCVTGSVEVPELRAEQEHPGLVHLVSTVRGQLLPGTSWVDIFGATFPPGSVTGAPKSTALTLIDDLEATPRGPYCGAFGWVDADASRAVLAVGIRTFWVHCSGPKTDRARLLRFGTGAGITWGSDSEQERLETELKAERLLGLSAQTWPAATVQEERA